MNIREQCGGEAKNPVGEQGVPQRGTGPSLKMRRAERLAAFAKAVRIYGGVAQLGEHLLCKQGVSGSIPLISTRRTQNPMKQEDPSSAGGQGVPQRGTGPPLESRESEANRVFPAGNIATQGPIAQLVRVHD